MMRARCALLAALLVFPACGSGEMDSPVGPSSTQVTFSGRLLDYVTQVPVAGALVTFAPFDDLASQPAVTDNDGRYTLTVPRTGLFMITVDGVSAGSARVNGRAYRGDLFISKGTCISRYGLVIDSKMLRPVAGATVQLGQKMVTGADGWYRLDLGCPAVVFPGGTTVMAVTHPRYEQRVVVVGRGVAGVRRLDVELERPPGR